VEGFLDIVSSFLAVEANLERTRLYHALLT